MNNYALKKYAVWARNELIDRVSQKALQYGISNENIIDAEADSVNGILLTDIEKKQRKDLIKQVKKKGLNQVVEEVSYAWFNRFSALRFMEVNGYLPSHVRIFTDENNNFKPQIITEAIHLEMEGLDIERIYAYKEADKTDELYKYLLITQCNSMNKILPGVFQRIADYTELLLPDNLLRKGSVIEQMIELVPEEDWQDTIEIIGWLYQYYNSVPKDVVFSNLKMNIKIKKEDIPAATQLFTPDWIVRYMVENTLGRLWYEGHPNEEMKLNWKYYLDEIEQEAEVKKQLDNIKEEYKALKPEDIKCFDPCMGSGHMLVYMFDVLMQIYECYGYNNREAVTSIIENNLYGIDIDDRAAQLAYFAVMMKACKYDKRFLNRKDENGKPIIPQPHVYAIEESNGITTSAIYDMGQLLTQDEYKYAKEQLVQLIDEFIDAKEYGSILKITSCDWDILRRFAVVNDEEGQMILDVNGRKEVSKRLQHLINIGEAMTQKYDVVVTNPPYMGNMPVKMTEYVQQNYSDAKYDLYSVFIQKCVEFTKKNRFTSLITQHTWMFISSFEQFRRSMLHYNFISLLHLGTRAFEAIGGEVVQTAAIVIANRSINDIKLVANRLVDYTDADSKKEAFLERKNSFITYQRNFKLLPGNPIVYWLPNRYFDPLKENCFVEQFVEKKAGVVTGNDNYFLRLWFEINYEDISFVSKSQDYYGKYHIMSKGGSARRFYGNYEYLIKLQDLWNPSKTNASVRRGDNEYYFKKAIGWSQVGNAQKTFRYIENSVCGTATPTIYLKNDKYFKYMLGFLNTKIVYEYLTAYNPTINLLTTDICNLPFIVDESFLQTIDIIVDDCIIKSKQEWDSFETSWDFKQHPLIELKEGYGYGTDMNEWNYTISTAYKNWEIVCNNRFEKLKLNQEELNRIFINIYGLQDELNSHIECDDVTVRKADLTRDIKSFISYAVGCMMGRFSLDEEGITYAGGHWDIDKFKTYYADVDNIIPICDDEYFDDDIVNRFVKFVEVVYGKELLEENLRFISDALGGKGSPKDIIRNYFLNNFFVDHCKTYQKRPIYWLFDSGKKNGFKCLIYMHRYQPDTIARIRTDYVHEQQARYRTAIADLEQRINSANTSERVKLNKQLTKLKDQESELRTYEEKIHHLADQMIPIDLDDGVKVNYAKFQDVLAKIK